MILFVITGFPGSGKSTLARKISYDLGIKWIDYDDITEPVINKLKSEKILSNIDQGLLIVKSGAYKILMDSAQFLLKAEGAVIVSAPFTGIRSDKTCYFDDFKHKLGSQVKVIEITILIDEDTLKERIVLRNSVRDKQKLMNWDEFSEKIREHASRWDPDIVIPFYANKDEYSTIIERLKGLYENF